MAKKKRRKSDSIEPNRDVLARLRESLGTVGEALSGPVASGVQAAARWAAFTHAVSPLLSASSHGTMTGEEIESALEENGGESEDLAEARRRKASFVESHGQRAWDECISSAGRLRIESALGRTRITKVNG